MRKFLKNILLILSTLALILALAGCTQQIKKEEKEARKKTQVEKEAEKERKEKETMATGGFELSSPSFEDGERIPVKFANKGVSGGQNVSIPLSWKNPPEGVKSFAITMIDRHPIAKNWVHWLVINIPSDVTSIPEGASGTNSMPMGSKELNNTFGFQGYGGPQPPPGSGDHAYETIIYALSVESLNLDISSTLQDFEEAIEGKVIELQKVTGKFSR